MAGTGPHTSSIHMQNIHTHNILDLLEEKEDAVEVKPHRYEDMHSSFHTIRRERKDLAAMPQKSLEKQNEDEQCARPDNASFFTGRFLSSITFSWIFPVICRLYSGALSQAHSSCARLAELAKVNARHL